jgi:hypothetical protein
MIRLWRWLDNLLARSLEPREREVVLGDLAECGAGDILRLRELLGILARSQAAAWNGWRPWAVLLGLLVPLSLALSLQAWFVAKGSATTLWLYLNNWDWNLFGIAAFRHDFPRFLGGVVGTYLLLTGSSWIGGFAIGLLPRPTLPVNGTALCVLLIGELVAVPRLLEYRLSLHTAPDFHPNGPVFALTFYRVILPALVQIGLVLMPSLWGMRWSAFKEKKVWTSNP